MKQLKSFWAALALMAAITVGFGSCDNELPPPDEGGNTDNPEIVTPADHSATAAIVNEAAKNISALLSAEISTASLDTEKGEYIFSLVGIEDAITLKTSASSETVADSKISIVSETADGTTTWYWKVDGAEFKINEKKIAITIIPSFKVENDKWMVSVTAAEGVYTDYIELGEWSDSDSSIDSFFASINPETTIGEGENEKKVASFKLIDGTEFSVNYFVEEGEEPDPDPDTYDYDAKAALVNAAAADLSKLLSGREIEAAAWNDSKQAYVISFYNVAGDLYLTKSASTATVKNAKLSVESEDVDGNTVWYWKSNGALLKDAQNNNVSVDKLPSFKIENKKWQVSTTYEMDANDNSLTYSNYADLCDFTDEDKAIDSFFASINPETTIGEGENEKKVASFKLIDGTEFNIAYHVDAPEPPKEHTLEDIVTFEIKNIGTYTVDVECTPTELCDKYTATIWSTSEDSSFDVGPRGSKVIDYDAMTAETLKQFKESLTQGAGKQQHLISTIAHTYSEQDLIKNTSYSSNDCEGFDNLFPGKNPFAIYVMAVDKEGNYYIDYKEINVKSAGSNSGSVTATINIGTVTQKSIEATITAPGASKVIVYNMDSAVGTPTMGDAQQAKPIPYSAPINFNTGETCQPNTTYYIVVIAIDANGGVQLSSQSVTTPSYTATGTASVTGATFTQQFCSEVNGTVTVSEGAKALRTIFIDEETFGEYFIDDKKEMSESQKVARINQMFLDPSMEGFIYSHTVSNNTCTITYPVEKILDVYKPTYAVWGSVQDAEGNWSKPQNLVAVANGAADATAPAGFGIYLDMKTVDDAVSFGSTGTLELAATQPEQTESTTFPIDFTASGLRTVRVYAARPEVAGGYIHKCVDNGVCASARDVISNTEYGNGHWTDVTVNGTSAHFELTVVPGSTYVILACGIDNDGKYTEPFNVAAALDKKAATATSTVAYYGSNYDIPYVYTMPVSVGDEPQGIWGANAGCTFEIVKLPDGAEFMQVKMSAVSGNFSRAYIAAVPTGGATLTEAQIKNLVTAAAEEKYNASGSAVAFGAASNGVTFPKTLHDGMIGNDQSITLSQYSGNVLVFLVSDTSNKCKLIGYYVTQEGIDNNSTTIHSFSN